ncbi:MAG TPA: ribosomal protein S18-alanine N-acetyltransferase [Terriglobales bacterium]|nr:ribosomal protein S18-alanine N-acetyltransferase [Terriglobales bacterium]
MNDGIIIRRGIPADLPEVIVLAETAAYWRPEEYEKIFTSLRTLLVAEYNGAILGFVIAHNILGEWELENIAVAPAHRRQGLGQQLVTALIREAEHTQAKAILLEVRESNTAAIILYERCGFQQYGRRKTYYSSPSEDGLLYRFLCNPATLENC